MYKNILNNLNMFFIVTLFAFFSLFPAPILWQCNTSIKIFLFLAFVDIWARKGNAIFNKAGSIYPWIFIISAAINIFFAIDKENALTAYLNMAMPLVFIYYMASEDFLEEFSFSFFARFVGVLSVAVSLLGLFECVFRSNPIYGHLVKDNYHKYFMEGLVKPTSTQIYPKILATYLLCSLPFSFLLFKRDKLFFKKLGMIGLILNTAVLILTWSRAAILGLILMGALYLWIERKYISMRLILSILLIFSFLSSRLLYPFNIISIDNLLVDKNASLFSIWNLTKIINTLNIVMKHPFVGLGFKNTGSMFDDTYLTILASAGLIGFTGFLIFIVYLIRKACRKLGELDYDSKKRWFLLTVLMSFIGLLADISGYDFIYRPNPYLYFCILAGCMSALSRPEQVKNNEPNA